MDIVYEPKGRAREYSPLALNVYNGCDHNCKYCYTRLLNSKYPYVASVRKNLLSKLQKQLSKTKIEKQVLLCFIGDPYCHTDIEEQQTRKVLELLAEYDIPIAILTKGGKRVLRDLDIFRKFSSIKIGATLTFLNEGKSKEWEVNASSQEERREVLKILHQEGFKTWVSLEPVIETQETLSIIEKTYEYVDEFKIGKLNYFKSDIDWEQFGNKAVELLKSLKKPFFIKEDLAKYISTDLLPMDNKP